MFIMPLPGFGMPVERQKCRGEYGPVGVIGRAGGPKAMNDCRKRLSLCPSSRMGMLKIMPCGQIWGILET